LNDSAPTWKPLPETKFVHSVWFPKVMKTACAEDAAAALNSTADKRRAGFMAGLEREGDLGKND
jgi:hypothetical protein